MKSTKVYRSQLESAYTLLTEDVTTLEKIEKLKSLLMGINPTLDQKLDAVMAHVGHLKAAFGGDLIHLASHTLPAKTESDKKRKKALLLFITSWKSLKSEVTKVQGYYDESLENSASTAAAVAKTGLFAKGPFGLITLAAVAVVGVGLLLRGATTTVTIENNGCPPIVVPSKLPFPIPGLRLPDNPIVSGIPATMSLPALTIDVKSSASNISATILGQTGSYSLPSRLTALHFDDISLLNQATTLKLNSAKTHRLLIECK